MASVSTMNGTSGRSRGSGGRNYRRRVFAVGSYQFEIPDVIDPVIDMIQNVFEYFVYLIGPLLILLASAIILLLIITVYFVILPMQYEKYTTTNSPWFYMVYVHGIGGVFFFGNVIFNYFMCVTTKNSSGPSYDMVCRQMAAATGFTYPETPQELKQYQLEFEDKMIVRMKCREARMTNNNNASNGAISNNDSQATNGSAAQAGGGSAAVGASSNTNVSPVRQWMLIGPFEWGFCLKTNQPKPPRSHFDHVTKGLVLCLDHYCPWMFNSVGYFNYRYFVNFLMYVTVGMFYAAVLNYEPFMMLGTKVYRNQLRFNRQKSRENQNWELVRIAPMVPHTDEKFFVTLSFTICLAVGSAVLLLCVFHIYLTLSAQTTIEFHANYSNRRKARKMGKTWTNPYSLGIKRNWQQIYGSSIHPLLAILPSRREPEFLPIPLKGDIGRRPQTTHNKKDDNDAADYEQLIAPTSNQSHKQSSSLSNTTTANTRKNAGLDVNSNTLDQSGSNIV